MKTDWETIITDDGSSSFYNKTLDETYHSRHGAIQESMHVFIKHGLIHCSKKEIRIFEMGLGTGLNVLLSALNQPLETKISYTVVEKNPLSEDLVVDINYDKCLEDVRAKEFLFKIHASPWGVSLPLKDNFSVTKHKNDFLEYSSSKPFDIIYYDAFAPRVQPYLWDEKAFECIDKLSHDGTIFVTYCAKGSVRRTLESIGFEVERLAGPPGKREMLRGIKKG
ncbi:MAG: tRNA U34 5-methylaminomethyl-2-thiouridine-forming methyltransferase MnmC [Candidatus Omnitrophota bacterium]|jgi:tRNA U34 5-methylaminomethyl-2-thiouridine-forming methyltransferase MnmC